MSNNANEARSAPRSIICRVPIFNMQTINSSPYVRHSINRKTDQQHIIHHTSICEIVPILSEGVLNVLCRTRERIVKHTFYHHTPNVFPRNSTVYCTYVHLREMRPYTSIHIHLLKHKFSRSAVSKTTSKPLNVQLGSDSANIAVYHVICTYRQ